MLLFGNLWWHVPSRPLLVLSHILEGRSCFPSPSCFVPFKKIYIYDFIDICCLLAWFHLAFLTVNLHNSSGALRSPRMLFSQSSLSDGKSFGLIKILWKRKYSFGISTHFRYVPVPLLSAKPQRLCSIVDNILNYPWDIDIWTSLFTNQSTRPRVTHGWLKALAAI